MVKVHIACPQCDRQSIMDYASLPAGKLKTTCHGCGHCFFLNKDTGLNCRTDQVASQEENDDGWRVDLPMCKGMTYDINGLRGLVQSGLLLPATRVWDVRGGQTVAGDVSSLASAFARVKARLEKNAPRS